MMLPSLRLSHLLLYPDVCLDDRVEMFLEKQIGQSKELDFYNHYRMLNSSSVRPSVSDSALLTNGLGVHESVDMYISAARQLDEIRRRKFPFLTTESVGKSSQNPRKSFSDSDVCQVISAESGINLQSSSSVCVNRVQEQEDFEPQPGPSGYVAETGRFKNLKPQSDPNCSACSSMSSLYSTESEVNVFFDEYMVNMHDIHAHNWADLDDDDDHSVSAVSSQESVLSAVSSVLLMHTDYNQWNEDDELVGPLGDDGWAVGSAEVVIDIDDTLEFNMQYPPLQPECERQVPAIPHRTPSESMLCDRKRKYYDELMGDGDHPSKRPRKSVSDTAVSSPPQQPEAPQQPRRHKRAARRRLTRK
ncbi:uncharacterized protein LOC125374209 [Haliotis rufescens]|uniref:uncharacterized protein LOC124120326 n=1 Tax=Haliotis rufescens TaxID=6454 RepID=UPI00201F93B7|nr:uncharacterized protein LOC124120326 [Haliotis rufescens]XP_048241075.1 uncharacterized protein LOC125374209 [Haliotis rufescens]